MPETPIVDGLKECSKCHQWKPSSEFRKGRNVCKICIALYNKKYRENPDKKELLMSYANKPEYLEKHKKWRQSPRGKESRKKAHAKYKADPVKHSIELNYKKNYRENPDKWARIVKYNRNRALKLKEEAITYKGGKCSICGYSKCTSALEFHHLDPENKEGYEGRRSINKMASLAKNKTELDKCILVCSNCHREIHAGLVNETVSHP